MHQILAFMFQINRYLKPFAFLSFILGMLACGGEHSHDHSAHSHAGLHIHDMDTTLVPGHDFYNYANGGWMAHTVIPDDETRWGGFGELRKTNDSMTLALVDKALADKSIDTKTDEGKVVTLFKTAMDLENLNSGGVAPIKKYLDAINDISSIDDFLNHSIKMEPIMPNLLGIYVTSDRKNSNVNTLYLGSGTLGLPGRDYYMEDTDDKVEIRKKYVAHITRMLQYLGDTESDAAVDAERILEFETKMAEAMLTKEESRNPLNTYNPMQIDDVMAMAPSFNWKKYLEEIGAGGYDEVIVTQPKYIKRVEEILSEMPIDRVKEYLRWSVLNDAAGYLSEELDVANWEFYAQTLRGAKKQKARKERVLQTVNRTLGEALGKLYVKEYFPPEAKEVAMDMVTNVKTAFGQRIDALDWMSDETKIKAHEKLATFQVKIGYPDKWKDYSDMNIAGYDQEGNYYENILAARQWGYNRRLEKLGKEVDKTEWFMSPQTVNAYYNPAYNEIVFPAAIMQPPFFDFKADAAVNYGGIGAVIGHEISHGFDDQGSRYDAEGNLNNWWTDEDREAFEARSQMLIDQYNAYEPLPGLHVNGEFTLGENIGDLGGVNAAYDGLQLHLANVTDIENIDGMTPNQRFFVSWATIWRTKIRDEALKTQIATDPHAPGEYRATGPLVNVDAWYQAFGVQENDPMYKQDENRVRIW